jgi:hypothetical protein
MNMNTAALATLAIIARVPGHYLPQCEAEREHCVTLFNRGFVAIGLQAGKPYTFRALEAGKAELRRVGQRVQS